MKVIKNKHKLYFLLAVTLSTGALLYICPPHFESTNAETIECHNSDPCETDLEMQFSVDVQETLGLTVTTPTEAGGDEKWAEGDVDTFLRNKIHVKVDSNHVNGYTAGMYVNSATPNLTHKTQSSYNIPTLGAAATRANFTTNTWGYSFDDASETGNYNAMVGSSASPITILSSENNQATASEKDVFFGAKADKTKASGTYSASVVFAVTSGTKGNQLPVPSGSADPGTPEGPSNPGTTEGPSIDDGPVHTVEAPSYSYTTNNRTYSSTSTASSSAVAVADDEGKKSTIDDYATPLGALERNSTNIQADSPVTRILMIVACSAAVVGLLFFILAKRRKDDDEEEQIQ